VRVSTPNQNVLVKLKNLGYLNFSTTAPKWFTNCCYIFALPWLY